ncbi:MAG: hypothetical protein AABZ44_02250, partial [Elusimicrobiota bacterium]
MSTQFMQVLDSGFRRNDEVRIDITRNPRQTNSVMLKYFALTACLVLSPWTADAQVPEVQEHSITPILGNDTTIDLSAGIDSTYFSFSEISTTTNRADFGYFAQKSHLAIKISEKPWIFNIKLDNISLYGVESLPEPLSRIETRYSELASTLYISQAYFQYQGLLLSDLFHLQAGIMPMRFGRGMVLDDNSLGIFGAHLGAERVLGPIDIELFTGNTESSSRSRHPQNEVFYMGNLAFERTGRWKIGYMHELDQTARTSSMGPTTGKSRRNNLLLSYDKKTPVYF